MKLRLLFSLLLTLTSLAAEPAEEARKLSEARDQEINRINLAYAQKLDALLAKAKTAGDTDAIKVIEGLIAKAEGKKEASTDPLAPLVGTWQHSEDSSIWKISGDTGVARGQYHISLSYDSEKKKVIVMGGNWVHYLSFTNDPNVVSMSYEEGGRTKRYKLKRIK